MKVNENFVSLATLASGDAAKLFAEKLEELLGNVSDGRYPAKAKRRLELVVELEPDDDRKRCSVSVAAKTKGPARRLASQLFIRKFEGRYVALESNPEQLGLFEDDQGNIMHPGDKRQ